MRDYEIKVVKNENDATVYHVQDGGCLQEFWTLEEAKRIRSMGTFIRVLNSITALFPLIPSYTIYS